MNDVRHQSDATARRLVALWHERLDRNERAPALLVASNGRAAEELVSSLLSARNAVEAHGAREDRGATDERDAPHATEAREEHAELQEAARAWGRSCGSPVTVVEALHALGEVLDGLEKTPSSRMRPLMDLAMAEAVRSATRNLEADARSDPLTGCANRRALEEDLPRAIAEARRSGLDLSVAVIDLDGLKTINDTLGHQAGDEALASLVATLRTALRETDRLYRFGGDEFVLIAPFTSAEGTNRIMRRAIEAGAPRFTWGVASLLGTPTGLVADPAAILIEKADHDMYERRRRTRGTRKSPRTTGKARREKALLAAASSLAAIGVVALVLAAFVFGIGLPSRRTGSHLAMRTNGSRTAATAARHSSRSASGTSGGRATAANPGGTEAAGRPGTRTATASNGAPASGNSGTGGGQGGELAEGSSPGVSGGPIAPGSNGELLTGSVSSVSTGSPGSSNVVHETTTITNGTLPTGMPVSGNLAAQGLTSAELTHRITAQVASEVGQATAQATSTIEHAFFGLAPLHSKARMAKVLVPPPLVILGGYSTNHSVAK